MNMKKFLSILVVTSLVLGFSIILLPKTTFSVVPQDPDEVWVDDDWAGHSSGDSVDGYTFGTDAFDTIQEGIEAVADGGTVHVANAGNGDINVRVVDISDGTPIPGSEGARVRLWGPDMSGGAFNGWVQIWKDADENGWANFTAVEIMSSLSGNGPFYYNINTYSDGGAYSKVVLDGGFWGQFITYDSSVEKTYVVLTPKAMDPNLQVIWNGSNSKLLYHIDLGDRDDFSPDWNWDSLHIENSHNKFKPDPSWGDKPVIMVDWLDAHGYTYDDEGAANGDYCNLTIEKASEGYSETFVALKSPDGLSYTIYLACQTKVDGEKENGSYDKINDVYTLTFDPTNVFDPGNSWTESPSMQDGVSYYAVLYVNLRDTPETGLNTVVTPGSVYSIFNPIKGPVENLRTGDRYYSIQNAIDNASSGDTVIVHDGVYEENITVSKSITLTGENPPTSGTSVINGTVDITSDNVTFKWFKVVPGEVSGDEAGIAIYASNVTVEENIIEGMTGDGTGTIKGIHVYSNSGINNIQIIGNTIKNIDNPLSSSSSYGGADGIMIQGAVNSVAIDGNVIQDIHSAGWAYGIDITPSAGGGSPQDVTITNNVVSKVNDGSIYNIDLTEPYEAPYPGVCFIVDETYPGSGDADAETVKVNFNTFIETPIGAVNKDGNHTLDANNNWWGDESGPYHPTTNPSATGNAVSNNVDYTPWLVPFIQVEKIDDPDPVMQGMNLTYTINWAVSTDWGSWDGTTLNETSVKVPSGLDFGSLELIDTLPDEVNFISCTGGGSEAGGVITWDLGSLTPGSSGSVSVVCEVKVDAPNGIITNEVELKLDTLSVTDEEDTTISSTACGTVIHDVRTGAYVIIATCTAEPEWRVVIPSKGYDTGWMTFDRSRSSRGYMSGCYSDKRYKLIVNYSSGRYHIIFYDRKEGISLKLAGRG